MKKYLWVILFFVTTLCFAQPSAAINQANTDNNLVIQLVDSKLVNLDNKIATVDQSNQGGIADLKARIDEKLADKFKQLDDRSGDINFWFTLISFIGAILGIVIPLIVLVVGWFLNRRIDKNIEASKKDLDLFREDATSKIKNQLEYAEKLLLLIKENHTRSKQLTAEQEVLRRKPPSEVTNENKDDIAAISKATKEQPEDQLTSNDWFIRGLNAHSQQKYHYAITYFDKAIELNNNEVLNSQIYSNLGVAKFKLGLYHDAIKDYDKAIELGNKNYPAYFNRAIVNSKLKNNESALKDYDKVIEIQPDYYDAYINLGIILVKLQRYDDALKNYDKAISLDPKDKNNYFDKACVYALMKNKPEALNWLEKALQLGYLVKDVLKDEDWKSYLKDADFEKLITKYNK